MKRRDLLSRTLALLPLSAAQWSFTGILPSLRPSNDSGTLPTPSILPDTPALAKSVEASRRPKDDTLGAILSDLPGEGLSSSTLGDSIFCVYAIGLKMAATHLRHMGPCEHPIMAYVIGPLQHKDVDRIRLSCTEYHANTGYLWHDIDFPGDMRHEHTLKHGARVIIPPGDGWDRDHQGAEWCYVCPWPHTRGPQIPKTHAAWRLRRLTPTLAKTPGVVPRHLASQADREDLAIWHKPAGSSVSAVARAGTRTCMQRQSEGSMHVCNGRADQHPYALTL